MPISPAKCTTLVSTLTTTSSAAMMAAVSAKSVTPAIGLNSAMPGGGVCREAGPTCRLTKRAPATAVSGANAASPTLRRRSNVRNPASHGRDCPAHTSPTEHSVARYPQHPVPHQQRIGQQKRRRRDRLDGGPERPRQTEEWTDEIVWRQPPGVAHDFGHPGTVRIRRTSACGTHASTRAPRSASSGR